MADSVVEEAGDVARPPAARTLAALFKAKLRESRFTSQSELARAAHLSTTTVSNLLAAQRFVPLDTVLDIAGALDKDPAWLTQVESAWQRAKSAWTADPPEPPPGQDQPEITPVVRELVLAQHRAAHELPYRLLVDWLPPLSALYVEQLTDAEGPAVVDPAGEPQGLVTALHEHRHIVFTADAGGGKSTALHHIIAESAAWWTASPARRSPVPPCGWVVPVRVKARSVAIDLVSVAIAETVAADLSPYLDIPISDEVFRQSPGAGLQWLVLVDGVDEILDSAQRQRVVTALARRIEEGGRLTRFAVASRPLSNGEFAALRSAGATGFSLRPFGRDQQLAFARNWFAARGVVAPDDTAGRFLRAIEDSRLGAVMRLPLLATIGVIVFESGGNTTLPTSRASLYRQFFHYLLDVRQRYADTRANLVRDLERYRNGRATAEWLFDNIETLLEHAADQHMGDSASTRAGRFRGDVHLVRVEDAAGRLCPFPIDTIPDVTGWLRTLLIGSGVLRAVGIELEFTHQSYAEYLASGSLARLMLAEGLTLVAQANITTGLVLDSSRETLMFMLGRWVDAGNNARPLVDHLLAGPDRNILLAAALVTGQLCVEPKVEAKVRGQLIALVADRQHGVAALNALAALPDQPPVMAVLPGLIGQNLPSPVILALSRLLHIRGQAASASAVLESLNARRDADPIDVALILDNIGHRDQALAMLGDVVAKLVDNLADFSEIDVLGMVREIQPAFSRKLMNALERIDCPEAVRPLAMAVFELGVLHPDFYRACVILIRLGYAPAAGFAVENGDLSWDERLYALRLADYDLELSQWIQLAILAREDPPPAIFWRSVIDDRRVEEFVLRTSEAALEYDELISVAEVAALFLELGADEQAQEFVMQEIAEFAPDVAAESLSAGDAINFLADRFGFDRCANILVDVIISQYPRKPARLSAAVGLVDVSLRYRKEFSVRDLLVTAVGDEYTSVIDKLLRYQVVAPAGLDACAAYQEVLALTWATQIGPETP